MNTNHLPHLITLIVNDQFCQNRDDDQREIMDEAAAAATEYAGKMSDERISERIAEFEQSATEVSDLDPAIREEIRAASKPFYEQIAQEIDPESTVPMSAVNGKLCSSEVDQLSSLAGS